MLQPLITFCVVHNISPLLVLQTVHKQVDRSDKQRSKHQDSKIFGRGFYLLPAFEILRNKYHPKRCLKYSKTPRNSAIYRHTTGI